MLREDFAAVTNPTINPNAETNFYQQAKAASNLGDFSMQKGKPTSRPQGEGPSGVSIFPGMFGVQFSPWGTDRLHYPEDPDGIDDFEYTEQNVINYLTTFWNSLFWLYQDMLRFDAENSPSGLTDGYKFAEGMLDGITRIIENGGILGIETWGDWQNYMPAEMHRALTEMYFTGNNQNYGNEIILGDQYQTPEEVWQNAFWDDAGRTVYRIHPIYIFSNLTKKK